MSGVVKSMDSAMRSMNLEKVGHLLSYSLTTFDEMLIEGETAFFSLGFWAKIMKNIRQYFQIHEMFISGTRTTQKKFTYINFFRDIWIVTSTCLSHQVSALMDKFEQQFEHLDVQSSYMENAMSDTTTLTVPQVRIICIISPL